MTAPNPSDIDAQIDDDGETEAPSTAPEAPKDPDAGAKSALQKERAARREAEKQLAEAKAYRQKIDAASGKAETVNEDAERAEAWQSYGEKATARAAFRDAGFKGSKDALGKLTRLLDFDEIEFDPETGDAEGLDEQIAGLKEDFPGLFKAEVEETDELANARKPKAPRIQRGQGADPGPKPLSADEQLAAIIMGTAKSAKR